MLEGRRENHVCGVRFIDLNIDPLNKTSMNLRCDLNDSLTQGTQYMLGTQRAAAMRFEMGMSTLRGKTEEWKGVGSRMPSFTLFSEIYSDGTLKKLLKIVKDNGR